MSRARFHQIGIAGTTAMIVKQTCLTQVVKPFGRTWRHSFSTIVDEECLLVGEWLTSNLLTTAPVQSAGHDNSRRAQGVERRSNMTWSECVPG